MKTEVKQYSDKELEALSKAELIEVTKQQRRTIDELRNQTKTETLNLLPEIEGFEFLKTVIDLGEPKFEVPETKDILPKKRWSAVAYKRAYPDLSEPERIIRYLEANWMNYRITRGILKIKMPDVYKYAEIYKSLDIIPTEEQLRIKTAFQRFIDQAIKE